MLKISDRSWQRLETDAETSLPRLLCERLRRDHADAVQNLDEAALHALVSRSIDSARAIGLTWRSSLWAFVLLAVHVHPAFHKHPRVRAVLEEDPFDTPDLRMRRLGAAVPDRVWREIAEADGGGRR